jgi:hypothetical protein
MITPSFGLTATERVLPKLALDFTTASLDGRVTFTRTTGASNPATYTNNTGVIVNATNNQPRFDYDPVTFVCKGLLIEEAKTNLLTYSAQFENVAWTYTNATVSANQIVAPDGLTTADKISESAATGSHFVASSAAFSATSGTTYTQSVYAKAGSVSVLQLIFASGPWGTNAYANYDLANGVLGTVGSSATATITSVGNDWYRLTLTAAATASTTGAGCIPAFCNNSTTGGRASSYAGNTASNVYIWGAQLEAGAFATSYIPTTTAALTRNADVATMTGTNFSDWWQAGLGGATVQALPSTVSGIRPLIQFDDGTANEIIALRGNTTNPELYIVDGGAPQAQIDAGTIAANTAYSLTGWWATNDCKARKDSGVVVTDTTASIPTVTQARLGSDGTNYLNGTLATIDYYNTFFGQPIYTRRKNKVFPSLL